jgi:hypothetical protein
MFSSGFLVTSLGVLLDNKTTTTKIKCNLHTKLKSYITTTEKKQPHFAQ